MFTYSTVEKRRSDRLWFDTNCVSLGLFHALHKLHRCEHFQLCKQGLMRTCSKICRASANVVAVSHASDTGASANAVVSLCSEDIVHSRTSVWQWQAVRTGLVNLFVLTGGERSIFRL